MIFHHAIRPLLFRLDAETVHHTTVEACRWAGAIPGLTTISRALMEVHDPALQSVVAGIHFENPIGLAAGWDKSARALPMLDSMGFGFVEIGSISARASVGNPKPRLFRSVQDQAIIVNYGLPNDGATVVSKRLAVHRSRHPLGVNVVKTNDGPNAAHCTDDDILDDYVQSVALTHQHASYLMLNLSCPNAEGGKDFFSQRGNIARLMERLGPLCIALPVFLKIAPNDDLGSIERLLEECDEFKCVRGFCFNLAAGKPATLALTTPLGALRDRPGAVSGKPVAALINRCISSLYSRMDRQRYSIIGTGGIFTAEDAYEKIRLGASLVQLYTALIYEGPCVVKHIGQGLVKLLKRDGYDHVGQAVGTASSNSD